MENWFVYVLKCADDTLYCGITTDVARRVDEHNSTMRGARYTKVRRPVALAYQEPAASRTHALIREFEIKALSRKEKLALVAGVGET